MINIKLLSTSIMIVFGVDGHGQCLTRNGLAHVWPPRGPPSIYPPLEGERDNAVTVHYDITALDAQWSLQLCGVWRRYPRQHGI